MPMKSRSRKGTARQGGLFRSAGAPTWLNGARVLPYPTSASIVRTIRPHGPDVSIRVMILGGAVLHPLILCPSIRLFPKI